MLKGNTFQGSSMTRNTHNNLLEQELREIRHFAGFKEVLPCSEPCPFLAVFLLTMFVNTLKYTYVSQQANINRQQAKMTFQFACRKPLSGKDLEPEGPVN